MTRDMIVLRCLADNYPKFITSGVISKQKGVSVFIAFTSLCRLAKQGQLVERLSLVALRRGVITSAANAGSEKYRKTAKLPRVPLNEYYRLLKEKNVKFATEQELTSAFAAFRLTEDGFKASKEWKGVSELLI